MTSTPAATKISPIDAVSRAIAQVRDQLFPFRLERWLALGLVAFLDQCGRTGGGGSGGNWSSPGDNADESILRGADWVGEHILLVVVLAVIALVFIVAVTALVLWLNSRGTFMYIDNVATGRADIVRPWSQHARHANSYFTWKFALALAMLVIVILMIVPVLFAIVSLARHGPHPWPIVVIVVTVLMMIVISLAFALFSLVLRDFVAPLQLASGASCGGALRQFNSLLRAHPGALVIYVLLKIVYAIVVGTTVMAITCVTCCTALCCLMLPVISQTILQPLLYFERAWSLQLLAAMGHDLGRTLSPAGADTIVPT
jgi:hypothetical protein